jgi:hypothetical protein
MGRAAPVVSLVGWQGESGRFASQAIVRRCIINGYLDESREQSHIRKEKRHV